MIHFEPGLNQCNPVISSPYCSRNIFLWKESKRGLTKINSIADKIGMTTNPSTPTEMFCPLITI